MKLRICDDFEVEMTAEEMKTVMCEVKDVVGVVKGANIGAIKGVVTEIMDAVYECREKAFKQEVQYDEFRDKIDPTGREHCLPVPVKRTSAKRSRVEPTTSEEE